MLRISPAAGSATFGYIYLADAKLRQQDAITAYFDSAGRSVTALPCVISTFTDYHKYTCTYDIR